MIQVEVTCVIVAFHRPEELAATLDGLWDQRIDRVVVNVENDARIALVASTRGARLVSMPGNPGYAAAVNAGAARAIAEVVIFANDDVRLGATAALALGGIISCGDADVAVPQILASDGTPELTIAALPTVEALAREWLAAPDKPVPGIKRLVRVEKWRSPRDLEVISAASAAVVACRRRLLREVPLPEAYFLYWEEAEWFWSLHDRGALVVYDPAVTAVHVGGRRDIRPAKSRLLARNAVRCVRRTQGPRAAVVAWLVVIAWNARLVAIDGARATRRPASRAVLLARLAGLGAAVSAFREIP